MSDWVEEFLERTIFNPERPFWLVAVISTIAVVLFALLLLSVVIYLLSGI